MFDIGFWEMLVIAVMGLVVLGPERLPGAIKSTMSTIRSVRRVATGFKDEVMSQIDAHELHKNLKEAEQMGMQNLDPKLQESVEELKAAAESVRQPYKKQLPSAEQMNSVESDISEQKPDLLPKHSDQAPNQPSSDKS